MSSTSTHAGGIQPSSSFFRPTRPSHYPLTPISSTPRSFPIDEPDDDPPHSPKLTKHPLLPIGGPSPSRKLSTTSRVRTSVDRVFGLSFDSPRNSHFDVSPQSHPSHSPPPPSPSRASSSSSSSSSSHSSHSPTPAPSFIATPPTPSPHSYPPARTPLLKPGSLKHLRKHHLHPSRNHFFLHGHFLTGGDSPWAFAASFTLTLGLSALWFSTTCVFWWHHGSGAQAIPILGGYMTALVITAMLATATADPGILPRGLDPDPPYPATSPSDGGVRAPMPRDLRVRNDVVRVKYCPTCKTYRPPRSSHCKMCDNCVDGCDHHCQWVNNCIGRRNYTTFFALLCAVATTLVLIIVTSALHLYLAAHDAGENFHRALMEHRAVGSAVAFCVAVIVVWPVSALLGYHLRLLLLNVTTIEQIRNQAHKSLDTHAPAPPNPFSYGTRARNFVGVLCRPRGYSWLDASADATEDRRAVNPGLGARGGITSTTTE